MENDLVVRSLRAKGKPVTRENYIRASWGRLVPDDEWTPEHEAQLPRALREE